MTRPACMTEAEWADWQRPIGVPMSRDREYVVNGGLRAVGRPPSGHPCLDCPLAFHLDMRAAGTCDGYPRQTTCGQPTYTAARRPRYLVVSSQPSIRGAAVNVPARPRRIVDTDPELGPVRYCGRCEEWWPSDAEFWIIQVRPAGTRNTSRGHTYTLRSDVTGYTCRACRREQQTAYAKRRRAVA